MPTITVHNDSFPEDQEFEIPGIGLVVNHEARDVDELQIAMYESYGLEFPKNGDLVIDQNNPYVDEPEKDKPSEDLDGDGEKESFKEDAPSNPPAVGLGAGKSVDKTKENK